MALLNEILSARFNKLLQAFLPLDEQEGSPVLAPEIMPTFVLESDRPEWAHVKGERLRFGAHSFLAAALEQAGIYLHNTSQNQIIVVEEVVMANTATDTVQMQVFSSLTPFTAATPYPRDLRSGFTLGAGTVTATSGAQSVASGLAPFQTRLLANTPYRFTFPIILGPGDQLLVNNLTSGNSLHVTFIWRERPAQPGELV